MGIVAHEDLREVISAKPQLERSEYAEFKRCGFDWYARRTVKGRDRAVMFYRRLNFRNRPARIAVHFPPTD